ncbi:PepSY-associated TM helix family protein 10 [Sterolibacterium denitrificans]|uniref:PepSY-associated TM helix family protein 10 n=1 Tax=Sterolibacterium denitrificans TaxID=157592 RepID=A0A7Z7HS45_9PROT|nr:PepSY-associated TM helix domain-containing protein [Sterolibacterium denitrificans]SMB28145.1 PepSY-associated TM helix family protein 10 [Sterolibacterium denitrificans]
MRSDFIRIYKSVHTWTGIVAGIALFIAFYAGALTVFKEPLARWAAPPSTLHYVSLEQAQELLVRTLAAHPDSARDFSIHLRDAEHLPARMSWQVREDDAGADDHDESSMRHYTATLDASGGAQVLEQHPSSMPALIDTLHRVVGLPVDSDPNRWVMGVIAALYTLALVSGVIVLLPSLVKDFFALRIGRNIKRMWLDAHNVVGIISLPFHIVMALSSVVFAYHDGFYYLQDKLIHDGKWSSASSRARPAEGTLPPPPRDPAAMLAPTELLARAQDFAPGFAASQLQYLQATGPRAVVRVWGKDETGVSPRARGGFLALDPYTGKVLSSDFLPGRQDTPNLFISSFFALHMASFGGTAVQWMYFLLGLAGAWLFYSGNLLWVETRRRKQAKGENQLPVQRRDTRLMAAATVGICLGSVCGISLAIAGSKWLHALFGGAVDGAHLLYYLSFFACIAWAFLGGAARASVHLLWLACATTLAIPLTTLCGILFPALDLWANTSAASLGVDLTALAGAAAFAWMARATTRRVRQGRTDSIWSAASDAPALPTSAARVSSVSS